MAFIYYYYALFRKFPTLLTQSLAHQCKYNIHEWMDGYNFFLEMKKFSTFSKKKINKNNCNCWKILHSNLQKRYAFFRNNYFLYEQVFHYGFVYKIVVVCNFSVYKLIGWVFFVVYLVIIDQSPKTWRCFI